MKVYDCAQGSETWLQLRRGIPTASQFGRIFAPVRRRPSEQRMMYLLELVDEFMHGFRDEPYSNTWTQRGQQLEPQARFDYTMTTGRAVRTVGFVTRDDGLCGGSPDGLVDPDGAIEIKCRAPHLHQALLDGKNPGHTAQVQGILYVCERSWCDLYCYSDTGPSVLKRIDRDDDYLAAFVPVLAEFLDELQAMKAEVAHAHGVTV